LGNNCGEELCGFAAALTNNGWALKNDSFGEQMGAATILGANFSSFGEQLVGTTLDNNFGERLWGTALLRSFGKQEQL